MSGLNKLIMSRGIIPPVVHGVLTNPLAAVLIVHGYLPGLLNTSVWNFLLEGDMRCMADKGIDALTSWCQAYGRPAGYPSPSSC